MIDMVEKRGGELGFMDKEQKKAVFERNDYGNLGLWRRCARKLGRAKNGCR